MAGTADEPPAGSVFNTTHWSVVLAARDLGATDAQAVLTRLCQTYWYPLYCCVRRHGYSPDDAQDLTQALFAKLLAKNQITVADPERGGFRTFLLRSLENFLRSYYRDATTQKRGGKQELLSLELETAEGRYLSEPADTLSPSAIFDRQWAGALKVHADRLKMSDGPMAQTVWCGNSTGTRSANTVLFYEDICF